MSRKSETHAPRTGQDVGTAGRFEDEDLRRKIAEAAYYRAQQRGFAPGGEQQDWFEAERELRGSADRPA